MKRSETAEEPLLVNMIILKPDQRILNILRTREAIVNELIIKAKIHQSKIYSILKQLEEQGKVKYRYFKDDDSQRYVKHYHLTEGKG